MQALLVFFFTAAIMTPLAQAKVFRNAYLSFELPDTWKCVLEHTEWVCRSEANKDSREAIIILTAKEVGPTDSLATYANHLGNPQTTQTKTGIKITSKVTYQPKQVKINDHIWVDGLHLGSEVANYFTRYLATIKDRIAILVTFSAHKDFYSKYSQDFFKAVTSLRVIAAKNILAQPEMGAIRPGSETLGAPINAVMPDDMIGTEPLPESKEGGGDTRSLLLAIAGVLLALAGYVFFKMKNSK